MSATKAAKACSEASGANTAAALRKVSSCAVGPGTTLTAAGGIPGDGTDVSGAAVGPGTTLTAAGGGSPGVGTEVCGPGTTLTAAGGGGPGDGTEVCDSAGCGLAELVGGGGGTGLRAPGGT
eukprot:3059959-Amphidinium_carterae.1